MVYSQILKLKKIQTKREKIWQKYKNTINNLKTDKFYLIKPIKKTTKHEKNVTSQEIDWGE